MKQEIDRPPRPSADQDLDLTAALRARPDTGAGTQTPRRSHASGRRPGLRTGGRVRMDSPKANALRARSVPVPGAPPYRRNRRQRNLKRIVLTSAAIIAMGAGIVFVFTTSRLSIRSVRIDGVSAAQAAALHARMPMQPDGRNLAAFLLMHGAATRRWMARAEPYFSSAAIGARFPHTLVFRVVRRQPYAMLVVANGAGGQYLLDRRGRPIYVGASAGDAGLPEVDLTGTSAASQSIVLGAALPANMSTRVSEAFDLLSRLTAFPSLGPLQSVQVAKNGDLGLNMTNDFRVKLGQPTQVGAKLSLVTNLLRARPDLASQAQYLDVSYPARPAVMPRASSGVDVSTRPGQAGQ